MSFTIKTITAPSQEPVFLADLKDYLRIDAGDVSNDSSLSVMLSAARSWAETYTSRKFIRQTLELLLDFFPGLAYYGGYPPGLTGNRDGGHEFFYQKLAFHLPFSPAQDVTSISFTSQSGSVTTLNSSQYIVDVASNPARITPLFGQTWPPLLFVPNAVAVTYDCGYGSAATVSMESDSAVLTGYTATAADIGATVSVAGAGPNGSTLYALISSVLSGVATLSSKAVGGVSGAQAVIGVPHGIRVAVIMLAAIWFENKIFAGKDAKNVPQFVETLLFPYRDLSRF